MSTVTPNNSSDVEDLDLLFRAYLSNTLHGGAVARTSALLLKVDLARKLLPTNPAKVAEVLDTLRENLRTASRELRYLMFMSYPQSFFAEGLLPACAQLAQLQKEVYEFTLNTVGEYSPRVHPQAMFALIEAVDNCRRHSQESEAFITTACPISDWCEIQVRDAGIGFDPLTTDSIGLQLMRGWMVEVGGSMQIESAAGKGTTVTFTVPVLEDDTR